MADVMTARGTPTAEKHDLMRTATRASLAVALLLLVVKCIVWRVSGSVSLLASLLDSAMDALASGLNLLAVHHALQPADREHRFGHGKLEPLAGLGQSLFIFASAVSLCWNAVERLRNPKPVEAGLAGIGVMVLAIVLTLLLVRYQRRVISRTASTAVGADSLHYESDLLMNAGVIVSLGASYWLGWTIVDPLFGMVVSVLIGRSAWKIGYESVQLLMDREFPEEERRSIAAIVRAHAEVGGLHDLRTRHAGLQSFIQFHLELNGEMTLGHAHQICDEVEASLLQRFPGAEILVHIDPGPDQDGVPVDGH